MITLIKKLYFPILLKRYLSAGINLGDAMSYSFMGKIDCFEKMTSKFQQLEIKIAEFGLVPHNLQLFIQAGGYGTKLPELKKGSQKEIDFIIRDNYEVVQASIAMQNSENSLINLMQK